MNLQAVYNAPGTWVVMRGTPTEYRLQVPNQYGAWALGKIADDKGQIADTMFTSGKSADLPQESLQNVTCTWAVKYDANSGRLNSKFNAYAIQGQPTPRPSSPPQAPPQTAPAAPQATNASMAPPQPHHVRVGRDATGVSIERQATFKAVCEYSKGRDMDVAAVLDMCHHGHKWIETGTVDFTVTHQSVDTTNYNRDQDDSDLPPEMRGAGKP